MTSLVGAPIGCLNSTASVRALQLRHWLRLRRTLLGPRAKAKYLGIRGRIGSSNDIFHQDYRKRGRIPILSTWGNFQRICLRSEIVDMPDFG